MAETCIWVVLDATGLGVKLLGAYTKEAQALRTVDGMPFSLVRPVTLHTADLEIGSKPAVPNFGPGGPGEDPSRTRARADVWHRTYMGLFEGVLQGNGDPKKAYEVMKQMCDATLARTGLDGPLPGATWQEHRARREAAWRAVNDHAMAQAGCLDARV